MSFMHRMFGMPAPSIVHIVRNSIMNSFDKMHPPRTSISRGNTIVSSIFACRLSRTKISSIQTRESYFTNLLSLSCLTVGTVLLQVNADEDGIFVKQMRWQTIEINIWRKFVERSIPVVVITNIPKRTVGRDSCPYK